MQEVTHLGRLEDLARVCPIFLRDQLRLTRLVRDLARLHRILGYA